MSPLASGFAQKIPLSLFIVTLITTTGPFSAYNVAHWSQKQRLQNQLLAMNGEFKNNLFVIKDKVQVQVLKTENKVSSVTIHIEKISFLENKQHDLTLDTLTFTAISKLKKQ